MYGAMIGDFVGSVYERHNVKQKQFPLYSGGSRITDDTVMTVAVASALLRRRRMGTQFQQELVGEMQRLGRLFPHAGYGGSFRKWLQSPDPKPYFSWGNGSAMRVSPCGLIAESLMEALDLAKQSAEVTHNHPDGITGAQAIAAAVYLAKNGASKEKIRKYICTYVYNLHFTLKQIRARYTFDVSCKGSVPQAIQAFLESENYEDCIRNAISIGGDSDTIAAMAGSIAWAYYGRDGLTQDMQDMKAHLVLPEVLQKIATDFEAYLSEHESDRKNRGIMAELRRACQKRLETETDPGIRPQLEQIRSNLKNDTYFICLPRIESLYVLDMLGYEKEALKICAMFDPLQESFPGILTVTERDGTKTEVKAMLRPYGEVYYQFSYGPVFKFVHGREGFFSLFCGEWELDWDVERRFYDVGYDYTPIAWRFCEPEE